MSFLSRCKSEIIAIITTAMQLMSCTNFSVTSQCLTSLQRQNVALSNLTGRNMRFRRCNFEIFVIITTATQVTSCPNSSVASQYLDTEEKNPP